MLKVTQPTFDPFNLLVLELPINYSSLKFEFSCTLVDCHNIRAHRDVLVAWFLAKASQDLATFL